MKLITAVLWAVCCCAAMAQTQPTATITSSTTTYTSSGGTVTFDVQVTSPSSLTALGVTIGKVPAGWAFAGVSGRNIPQIAPENGTTGRFEFAYTTVPASPVSFSFSATYPAGLTGNQVFSDCAAIVRPSNNPTIPVADIVLAAASNQGQPTPPSILVPPVAATVDVGRGVSFTVTATGTAPLTFQWRKDGVAIGGATSATYTIVSTTATSAGNYSVAVTNAAGSVVSSSALLTVRPAVIGPAISAQPLDAAVAEGQNVTFTVVATGTAPLTYQWRKDGVNLTGATAATLALSNIKVSAAGSYSVVVSNSSGSVTSGSAILTVTVANTNTPPQIATHPVAQTVKAGDTVVFSVAATGTAPLAYQWRKDGVPVPGATNATLTLASVGSDAGGTYTVAVTNVAGTAVSNGALLTVTTAPESIAGVYFGPLSPTGNFALLVRPDRTLAFLAFLPAFGLVARQAAALDGAGRFQFEASAFGSTSSSLGKFVVEGVISSGGILIGSISGLRFTLNAGPVPAAGDTARTTGFYQVSAAGESTTGYLMVGANGEALVVTNTGGTIDGGKGTIDALGGIAIVTTERAIHVTGLVSATTGIATVIATPAGGSPRILIGADNYTRADTERLINVSTRSLIGAGSELIAGFVITGQQPKPVLIRAIGPSLGAFGVSGALPAARLSVFKGATQVATGDDWGRGTNAAAIASAMERVGAFALAADSRDAALLLTLEPGAYSAVASGQGSAAGIGLVEIYDASESGAAAGQRIVNLSTRTTVGGANTLIVGFVVNGLLPKRVLVRGVGPTLAQFGVSGVLAQPRVAVFLRDTLLAENTGWSTSADAPAIAQASAEVGAFALQSGAGDAALVINLAPGAYTAQVSGVAGGNGVALVEIYEVP